MGINNQVLKIVAVVALILAGFSALVLFGVLESILDALMNAM